MRKHIFWIIGFLSLAFIGDRMVGFVLKNITKKSQFRYSRLYNSNSDAEILFVGNSRGLTFYQPEVEKLTSMNTMNLSYNGMPADLSKCLVMDYLDRHNPPKVMVVDITLCDRTNDVLKSGFNLYTTNSFRIDTLLRGIQSPDNWAGRKIIYGGQVSWLYRHNSEIFQRVLYHLKKSDKDWLIDRVIGVGATTDTSFKSYQVRMFPEMVGHLKEMIDYAKSKGVEVKLVINPYFPAFAQTIRDSFLTPLKNAVEAQTGLTVMDYSTALTERDEIGDYQHANKKGSIKYMQILSNNGYFNLLKNNELGNTLPSIKTENTIKAHDNPSNFSGNTPSVSDTRNSLKEGKNINAAPVAVSFKTPKPVIKSFKKKKTKGNEGWYSVDTLFND
jgi:hypothetical protein